MAGCVLREQVRSVQAKRWMAARLHYLFPPKPREASWRRHVLASWPRSAHGLTSTSLSQSRGHRSDASSDGAAVVLLTSLPLVPNTALHRSVVQAVLRIKELPGSWPSARLLLIASGAVEEAQPCLLSTLLLAEFSVLSVNRRSQSSISGAQPCSPPLASPASPSCWSLDQKEKQLGTRGTACSTCQALPHRV